MPLWPGGRQSGRATSATNQACWETNHTSRYRSRPPRQAGSQFSPDMCPTMKVGMVRSPASRWRSRKSIKRSMTSSSSDLGLGHEIGPVTERPRQGAAVRGQDGQLLPHDLAVVTSPHPRAAGARPEVDPDPIGRHFLANLGRLWRWWSLSFAAGSLASLSLPARPSRNSQAQPKH